MIVSAPRATRYLSWKCCWPKYVACIRFAAGLAMKSDDTESIPASDRTWRRNVMVSFAKSVFNRRSRFAVVVFAECVVVLFSDLVHFTLIIILTVLPFLFAIPFLRAFNLNLCDSFPNYTFCYNERDPLVVFSNLFDRSVSRKSLLKRFRTEWLFYIRLLCFQ